MKRPVKQGCVDVERVLFNQLDRTGSVRPSAPSGPARVQFDLISMPLYAVGEIGRGLDALRTEEKKDTHAE